MGREKKLWLMLLLSLLPMGILQAIASNEGMWYAKYLPSCGSYSLLTAKDGIPRIRN